MIVIEKVVWAISHLIKNPEVCKNTEAILKCLVEKLKWAADQVIQKLLLQAIAEILLSGQLYSSFLEAGGIPACVSVLNQPDLENITLSLTSLFLVSSISDTIREQIVSAGVLIPLVYILEYIKDEIVLDLALQLLVNLSYTDVNESQILESGILLSITDIFGNHNESIMTRCTMLLANLSLNSTVREAIMYFGWDIIITQLLQRSNPELKKQSLRFITNISANDVCRKILMDTNIIKTIMNMDFAGNQELENLAGIALSNLNVPVPKEVEQYFEIEVVEIEIRDDFKGWFGEDEKSPETGNPVPQEPTRARTMTMARNPKDSPLYMRREKIARELLETEEKYVQALSAMVDVYYNPLMALLNEGKPILSYEEIETLFSVISVIHGLHKTFLTKLSDRLKKWTWDCSIGDLFIDLCRALKIYKPFINNYENALAFCSGPNYKKKAFANFLKDSEKQVPEIKYSGLPHFLIQPIQRIPRYVLLLEQMLKYTPEIHVDYGKLKIAVDKLREMTLFLNESKRTVEMKNKILQASSKLTSTGFIEFNDKMYPLIGEGRSFIKEGIILQENVPHKKDLSSQQRNSTKDAQKDILRGSPKESPKDSFRNSLKESQKDSFKKKKSVSRYVNMYLFSDLLVISSVAKGFLSSKTTKILNVINIDEIDNIDPMENDKLFRFSIKLVNDENPIILITSNTAEKKEWLDSFSSIIEFVGKKHKEKEAYDEIDKMVSMFSMEI